MRVCELQPGDVIAQGHERAIVISVIAEHPYYTGRGLSLVIWRMLNRGFLPGEVSFDALSPEQEVGTRLPMPHSGRDALRQALGIMKGGTPERIARRNEDGTP